MADGNGGGYREVNKSAPKDARVRVRKADLFADAFGGIDKVPAPIGIPRQSTKKEPSPLPKKDSVSSRAGTQSPTSLRKEPVPKHTPYLEDVGLSESDVEDDVDDVVPTPKARQPAKAREVAPAEEVYLDPDIVEFVEEVPMSPDAKREQAPQDAHKRIDKLEAQIAALHKGQGDMHKALSHELNTMRAELSLSGKRLPKDDKLVDLPDLDFNPDGDGMDVPILSFVKPPVPVKKETAALRGSLAPETIAPKNGRMRMLSSRKQETSVLGGAARVEALAPLDNKELSDRRLAASYQEEQRQKAQERAEGVAIYAARAAEYKKQLEDAAGRLAERGEFVELPFQPSSPPIEDVSRLKSSWISSIGSGLKNGFKNLASALSTPKGEKSRAELMREYEVALERYETAEQTKTAIEKNLPVFRRSMQGASNGVGSLEPAMSGTREDNRRLNEQITFEKKLQALEKAERLARDIPTMILSGKTFEGRPSVNDSDRKRWREEFMASLNEAESIEGDDGGYGKATRKRRMELPMPAVMGLLNAPSRDLRELPHLSLPQGAYEPMTTLVDAAKDRLEILDAKAHAGGVSKEERTDAQERLRDVQKLVGGKTPEEIARRIELTVTAFLNTSIVKVHPVSQWRLAEIYKGRVHDIVASLGMDRGELGRSLQELIVLADKEMALTMQSRPEEAPLAPLPEEKPVQRKVGQPLRDQRNTVKIPAAEKSPAQKTGWRRFLPW